MSRSMPAVDQAIAAAEREWRALGVERRERAALAADLRAELEAASADGFTPADLLGTDPAGFARRLAEESGVDRLPPRYGPVLGVASVGGVLALVVGFAAALGLHQVFVAAFDLPRDLRVPVWLAAGVFYGGVVAVVVVGAALAVRVALRGTARIGHTAVRMTLLLPLACAAAIAAAALFGRSLDYPLTPVVVATEAAIVLAGFLGATVLARRWSVTSGR